jgi:hypothetical protein
MSNAAVTMFLQEAPVASVFRPPIGFLANRHVRARDDRCTL